MSMRMSVPPPGALDFEVEIGAVKHAQALAHVAEADSLHVNVGHLLFRNADAVVFDFDVQPAVRFAVRSWIWPPSSFGAKPVLQAIFHDGLQQHAGNERFERVLVDFLEISSLSRPKRATSMSR